MFRQTVLISALLLASIPFAPQSASAQTVSCESTKGRLTRCRIDAPNGVRLVRERSNTSCQGNWSYRDGYITVRNGCRGDFEARRGGGNNDDWESGGGAGNRQRVACESVNGRIKTCPIDTRNGVRLVEERSGASCRNNWRAADGYVTVRNGCRGVFEARRGGGGGGDRRYRDFGNLSGIGDFVVDRSSYFNNGRVREFDAIVNDYQERWWVNCRSGVMGQGDETEYTVSRSGRRSSAGEVVDFVCNDRY